MFSIQYDLRIHLN